MARYIGGLRVQIQEIVNLFDPISVSAAHQRVVQIEKQLGQRPGGGLLIGVSGSTDGVSRATDNRIVVWVGVQVIVVRFNVFPLL